MFTMVDRALHRPVYTGCNMKGTLMRKDMLQTTIMNNFYYTGATKCRSYKYLFRAGSEHVTRTAAIERSITAPIVPFIRFCN